MHRPIQHAGVDKPAHTKSYLRNCNRCKECRPPCSCNIACSGTLLITVLCVVQVAHRRSPNLSCQPPLAAVLLLLRQLAPALALVLPARPLRQRQRQARAQPGLLVLRRLMCLAQRQCCRPSQPAASVHRLPAALCSCAALQLHMRLSAWAQLQLLARRVQGLCLRLRLRGLLARAPQLKQALPPAQALWPPARRCQRAVLLALLYQRQRQQALQPHLPPFHPMRLPSVRRLWSFWLLLPPCLWRCLLLSSASWQPAAHRCCRCCCCCHCCCCRCQS